LCSGATVEVSVDPFGDTELRDGEVLEVVGDDRARSAYGRGGDYVFVAGVGQAEGTVVWLPAVIWSISSRNIGLFASVDQLVCLVVVEFGQDGA